MNRKFVLYLLLFGVIISCHNKNKETIEELPIVRLDPQEADTLNISEYFKEVSAFWFKDCLYNRLYDFIELKNGYLTKVLDTKPVFLFFHKNGDYSHQVGVIGRGAGEYLNVYNALQISKDTTLWVVNNDKFLEYTLHGDALREKKIDVRKNSGNTLIYAKYLLNDSLLLLNAEQIYIPMKTTESKNNNLLAFYSMKSGKIIQSYFSMDDISNLKLFHQLYKYKDTLSFYNDADQIIYRISPEKKIARYKIDKGKYVQHQTLEEFNEALLNRIPLKGINIQSCNETKRYIIGRYSFKSRLYIFIYDKQNGQTRNFRTINNDLLGSGTRTPLFDLPQGFQFKEDCIWLTESRNFLDEMEQIKNNNKRKEWNDFECQHPDFMQIYKELKARGEALEEETPIILIRYYFK